MSKTSQTKKNTISNMMTKIKSYREEIETTLIGAVALAILVGLLYFFPIFVFGVVALIITIIASYVLGYAAIDGLRNILGGGK